METGNWKGTEEKMNAVMVTQKQRNRNATELKYLQRPLCNKSLCRKKGRYMDTDLCTTLKLKFRRL
jgi:hypothetical protein